MQLIFRRFRSQPPDYQAVALPPLPPLPNLPNGARASVRPATTEPTVHVSVAAVPVPAGPVPGG